MNALRIIGGLLSLLLTAAIGFVVYLVFRYVTLAVIRRETTGVGENQQLYVGSLFLNGWQIVIFNGLLALLALGLGFLAMYLFTGGHKEE